MGATVDYYLRSEVSVCSDCGFQTREVYAPDPVTCVSLFPVPPSLFLHLHLHIPAVGLSALSQRWCETWRQGAWAVSFCQHTHTVTSSDAISAPRANTAAGHRWVFILSRPPCQKKSFLVHLSLSCNGRGGLFCLS